MEVKRHSAQNYRATASTLWPTEGWASGWGHLWPTGGVGSGHSMCNSIVTLILFQIAKSMLHMVLSGALNAQILDSR